MEGPLNFYVLFTFSQSLVKNKADSGYFFTKLIMEIINEKIAHSAITVVASIRITSL
jgi:hypothetical protein